MTLDFLCNGRYLHLNFDVTLCDFYHHVTSVKAVITILPSEVITVRGLDVNRWFFLFSAQTSPTRGQSTSLTKLNKTL
jgi:hypothetical protein